MTGCLLTYAALLSGKAPGATLFRLMRRAGPFSRSGEPSCRVVRAFGVEGAGPTWDEAVSQWVEGARWLAAQPVEIQPSQLALPGVE